MLAQLPSLSSSADAGIDSSGQTAHEQIILHLDDRGFVPFHPALAETFGHKAAIFVGMALYWTRHSLRNQPQRGGWFHMSMVQWQQAIGLTRSEQATVRESLMLAGILEEMLIGRPAVMNYRINVAALADALAGSNAGLTRRPTWDAVGSWLRSCKVYYKPLADIAGSIAAGLYLSYLLQCYRDRVRLGQLDNGCISVSQDDIAVALTLGTKVQRNARDRLKKAGLIQESGAGGTLVRINFDAVLMCLRGQAIKPLKGARTKQQVPLQQPKASAPVEQRPQSAPETATGLTPLSIRPAKHLPEIAAGARVDLSSLGIAFGQLSLNLVRPAPVQHTQRSRDLLMAFLADDPTERPLVGNRQVAGSGEVNDAKVRESEKFNPDNGLTELHAPDEQAADQAQKIAVSCNLEIAETCKQELPFPATYIQGGYSINTTTTSKTCDEVHSDSGGGVFENSSGTYQAEKNCLQDEQPLALIFPAKLTESQRLAVANVLSRAPQADRQELLDELHGKLENGKEVRSPAGWLNAIIAKKKSGEEVVLAYASQVAAGRAEIMTREKFQALSEKYGVEGGVQERFIDSIEMREALAFLKPGIVYRMGKSGTLVTFDTSINQIRVQRRGEKTSSITLNAKPIVNAIRANDLFEHTEVDK